ncbi:MAG: hypothetical protein ACFFCD_17800 [Promethearchaeota archaeon]
MELQYNLLWFEDSERLVRPLKKRISNYLKDLGGFSLDLTYKEDSTNLDQCFTKEFDLILVDWNLNPAKNGKKMSGEKLIQEIRRKGVFTEIIFYSAIDDFEAQSFRLDGVYFTDTDGDNLFLRMQDIIMHTLQRNLRLSVTRGLFVASTIALIYRMEEIISGILKLSNAQLDFFQDYIIQAGFFTDRAKFDIIKDYLANEIKKMSENMQRSHGKEKEKLTKKLGIIRDMRKKFGKFLPEVIEIRNCLAHARSVPNRKNTLRVWNKDKKCYEDWEFDLNRCKDIRTKFLSHEINLEKILSLINGSLL